MGLAGPSTVVSENLFLNHQSKMLITLKVTNVLKVSCGLICYSVPWWTEKLPHLVPSALFLVTLREPKNHILFGRLIQTIMALIFIDKRRRQTLSAREVVGVDKITDIKFSSFGTTADCYFICLLWASCSNFGTVL